MLAAAEAVLAGGGTVDEDVFAQLRRYVTARAQQDEVARTSLVVSTCALLARDDGLSKPAVALEFLGNCVTGHAGNQAALWSSALCRPQASEGPPMASLMHRALASGDLRAAHALCMIVHACCVNNGSEARLGDVVLKCPRLFRFVAMLSLADDHGWSTWIVEAALDAELAAPAWACLLTSPERAGFMSVLAHSDVDVTEALALDMIAECARADDAFEGALGHAFLLAFARLSAHNLASEVRVALVKALVRWLRDPGPASWDDCRPDMLRVLANAVDRSETAQDAALVLGGVEAALNHCKMDPSRPAQHEWALFAVRNLCADNERVQARVAMLKPVGSKYHS